MWLVMSFIMFFSWDFVSYIFRTLLLSFIPATRPPLPPPPPPPHTHTQVFNPHLQIVIKVEIRNRFNLISEYRVKHFGGKTQWKLHENQLKNKEVMTLWSFVYFQETFLDQSIWISKWVSWWCHSLTTCHIFCTWDQNILEITLFCIYSERN